MHRWLEEARRIERELSRLLYRDPTPGKRSGTIPANAGELYDAWAAAKTLRQRIEAHTPEDEHGDT